MTEQTVGQPAAGPSGSVGGSGDNHTKRYIIAAAIGLLFLVVLTTVVTIVAATNKTKTVATVVKQKTEISITADGFVPQQVSVPAGTIIVFKNNDAAPHKVASDPYPENNGTPGFGSGDIVPGASYTYTLTDTKNITYHDNANPSKTGTITVTP